MAEAANWDAKRRVLHLAAYYPPHLGGVERVAQALAESLAARREVDVITTALGADASPGSHREPQSDSRSGAVRVNRYKAVEIAHTPVSWGLFTALLKADRGAVWHLHCAQALIAEQVMIAARLRRQKYLLHFHLDVGVSGPLGRLLPLYKKYVFARAVRAAAGVIVLTAAQASFVQEVYRVPADRIHVVPNGVADRYFRTPRRSPGSGSDKPRPLRLLFVGRLEVQKNVARLIDALALVTEDVQLRVVGDGSLRPELERLAAAAAAPVEFAGALDGEDLLRAYAGADVFVLPSDREGMALVALEAMAAGLPVIATDVPGNTELIAGRGLLADPDPAALAEAIDTLAADPELRAELARRCAAAVRDYSWDAIADRVEQIYDEVYP
jgi:glycosyltransferase involved in cell wall biosynthesis